MINSKFKQLIRSAKKISLSDKEKFAIKQSVLNFISLHPVQSLARDKVASPQDLGEATLYGTSPVRLDTKPRLSFRSNIFLTKLNFASIMAIFLILTLLVGGGVAVGAEKALPGDTLYPVKVNVNEEMHGWLYVSDEAKTNWEIELVQRRLGEAEQLASNGSLDNENRATIEANLHAHSERIKNNIAKFEHNEDFKSAIDVSSNLESTLKAHEKILGGLIKEETDIDSVIKTEIKPIKAKVDSEIRIWKKLREDNEIRFSAKTLVDIQTAAEGKLKAAENKIKEVRQYLASLGSDISTESRIQAEARLKLADDAVVEGKTKMEAKAYGDAFLLFQKSIRTAQEAKLLIEANEKLEVEVKAGDDQSDASSGSNDNGNGEIRFENKEDLNFKNGTIQGGSGLRINTEF